MKNWTEKQLIQYFRQKFQTRVLLEVICLICISMILFAGITQSWWWPYLVILGYYRNIFSDIGTIRP